MPESTAVSAVSENEQKWWQDELAYEIYVKSFKDSDGDGIGNLKGITSQLDYLEDLGVGILWLTPCYVSPQADNGYDIADYYNIDPANGTMADMEELIAKAAEHHIKIVMDLVFNHTSDQNAWFTESRSSRDSDKSDWYIWRDPKEDGSAPINWRSIFGGSAWEYDETRNQYYLHTFLPEQPDQNWYRQLSAMRKEHTVFIDGTYEELFADDEQIFAYIRENAESKAVVLINLSKETASYDTACLGNAKEILGTHGEHTPGTLQPMEAVIYEEIK